MKQFLRPPRGFTLIEVMIVLIVLGILAAIAYPSFVGFLIRTDRGDAREAIAAVQLAQERYRGRNPEYTEDLTDLALSVVSPKGLYDIEISDPTRDGFTVTARARTDGRQVRDTQCPEIRLTVSPTGETRNPTKCW